MMDERRIEDGDLHGDADAGAPGDAMTPKPMSPSPHIESGGQRADAIRRDLDAAGDDGARRDADALAFAQAQRSGH